MVNGNPSRRIGADPMGPDQGPDSSGVGRRIIPEEPIVVTGGGPPLTFAHRLFQALVLNLGISLGWQHVNVTTTTFPTEMLIDYVRIYQRKGQENVGCSPDDYPTVDYVNNHMDAYTSKPDGVGLCHQFLTLHQQIPI